MTYMSEVLADSPDVYYRLSETGSGPFVDVAGGFNATPNAAISSQPSLLLSDSNASAKFDAGTAFYSATTSHIVSQQPMTVEWWQKRTGVGSSFTTTYIMSSSNGAGGWSAGYQDTGTFIFVTQGVFAYSFAGAQAQDGVLLHVVFVLDASNAVSLYLNGVLQQTVTHGSPIGASTTPLKIGGINAICFPRCVVDEAAVYKSALSAARISAHYLAARVFGVSCSASQAQSAATLRSVNHAALAAQTQLAAANIDVTRNRITSEGLASCPVPGIVPGALTSTLACEPLQAGAS